MNCPICHQTMIENETAGLISCDRTFVKVPEFDKDIETVHAMYYLKDGIPIIRIIEALPYIFHIHDDPKYITQTRISKLVPHRSPNKTTSLISFGNQQVHCEQLIIVPGIINIQWDNFEAIKERIQMYMLFS